MQAIEFFLDKHRGEEAWVFGKGPSLDHFDMAQAGNLRICINESVLVVPSPTYFFAHDELPIRRAAERWPQRCLAILQPVRAEYATKCGIPQDSIFTYTKRQGDERVLSLPPWEIARKETLYGKSGTVHSALHFCHLIGAVAVTLVGFDGGGGYAECIDLAPGGRHHAQIRVDSVRMLRTLGLPHAFFSCPMTAEGNKLCGSPG